MFFGWWVKMLMVLEYVSLYNVNTTLFPRIRFFLSSPRIFLPFSTSSLSPSSSFHSLPFSLIHSLMILVVVVVLLSGAGDGELFPFPLCFILHSLSPLASLTQSLFPSPHFHSWKQDSYNRNVNSVNEKEERIEEGKDPPSLNFSLSSLAFLMQCYASKKEEEERVVVRVCEWRTKCSFDPFLEFSDDVNRFRSFFHSSHSHTCSEKSGKVGWKQFFSFLPFPLPLNSTKVHGVLFLARGAQKYYNSLHDLILSSSHSSFSSSFSLPIHSFTLC